MLQPSLPTSARRSMLQKKGDGVAMLKITQNVAKDGACLKFESGNDAATNTM